LKKLVKFLADKLDLSDSSAYGVTLRELLGVPAYRANLPKKTTLKVVQVLSDALSPTLHLDPNESARILRQLVVAYPFDMFEIFLPLYDSFVEFFARDYVDEKIATDVLAAVNAATLAASFTLPEVARSLTVALQEFCQAHWETKNPPLKHQLISFYRIQCRLHISYTGEVLRLEGLLTLFESLIRFLETERRVTRKAGFSLSTEQKAQQTGTDENSKVTVDLAADVFFQLADYQADPEQVNQLTQDAKRVRLSSVWERLSDEINAKKILSPQFPLYLQLFTQLLQKRPGIIGAHALSVFLRLFQDIIDSEEFSKLTEVQAKVLEALKALASYPPDPLLKRFHFSQAEAFSGFKGAAATVAVASWGPIFASLLGRLAGFTDQSMTDQILQILSLFLKRNLLEPASLHSTQQLNSPLLLWKLTVFTDPTKCSNSALRFLKYFLLLFELPQQVSAGQDLREQLVRWVVTALNHQQFSTTKSAVLSPSKVASVLVLLCKAVIPQRPVPTDAPLASAQDFEQELAAVLTTRPLFRAMPQEVVRPEAVHQISITRQVQLHALVRDLLKARSSQLLEQVEAVKQKKTATLGHSKHTLAAVLETLLHQAIINTIFAQNVDAKQARAVEGMTWQVRSFFLTSSY
jgi:hypothetical protein